MFFFVRDFYEPGELKGQQQGGERRRRSTDPIWSVDVHKIKDGYIKKYQPAFYYLDGGPKWSFVFEELQLTHSGSLVIWSHILFSFVNIDSLPGLGISRQ